MKLKKIYYLSTKKETKLPVTIYQTCNFELEEVANVLLIYFIKRIREQNLVYSSYKDVVKNLTKFIKVPDKFLPDKFLRTYYNIDKLILPIFSNYLILDKLKTNYYFYKSFSLKENTAVASFIIINKKRIGKSLYTNFYYLTPYFLILSKFMK